MKKLTFENTIETKLTKTHIIMISLFEDLWSNITGTLHKNKYERIEY